MLIILEGADAVGKTTVANDLVKAAYDRGIMKVVRLAAGPPTPGLTAIELYENALLPYRDAILDRSTLVIADRWHLGELVYGPLLRGGSLLGEDEMEHIELMLDALGAARYIVTVKNPGDLEARYMARGDALVSLTQTLEINRWYVYWRAGDQNRSNRWRLLRSPVDEITALLIIDIAMARTDLVSKLAEHPTYIGPPQPRALFVGDVPNGWKDGDPPVLAFVPMDGNSASYLMNSMRLGNVTDVGLVNSADADLGSLWVDLGTPHVLALGKRAAARLLRASVPYALTNHPQWKRRFRHKDQALYAEILGMNARFYPPVSN